MRIIPTLLLAVATIFLLAAPRRIEIKATVPEESLSPSPEAKQEQTKTVEEVINDAALRHGIDSEKFLATARCESGLKPTAVGDGGTSFGLWQIHLPAHPSVTEEFAHDVASSTEWAAGRFRENPRIWTCYRILFDKQ